MFDSARYYDPNLGRFISADTIVPGAGSLTISPHDATAAAAWSQRGAAANPQQLNRYSYVLNNPVRNVDPTGHVNSDGRDDKGMGGTTGRGGGPGGRGGAKGGQGTSPITPKPLPDMRGKTMESDGSIHPTGQGGGSGTSPINTLPSSGSTCVGTPNGTVVRVPPGYQQGIANNNQGSVYRPAGSSSNAQAVRIGDPNPSNPNGYVRYYPTDNMPIHKLVYQV